jgi:hypothetical protein
MSIAVSLRLDQTDPVFLFRLSRRQGLFTLTGFPSIAGVWMKNPIRRIYAWHRCYHLPAQQEGMP